jgi:hypothetical protein
MNVKQKIAAELQRENLTVFEQRITKYIAGNRLPSFVLAEKLANILGSDIRIWLDRSLSRERKCAVNVYANKTGTAFHSGPGRPKVRT